jgi:hypothetical protein
VGVVTSVKDGSINIPVTPVSSVALTTRFDYGTRTDGNPVFIGSAPPGASDTDVNSTAWTIQSFTYILSGVITVTAAIKVATSVAWANRATVNYQ